MQWHLDICKCPNTFGATVRCNLYHFDFIQNIKAKKNKNNVFMLKWVKTVYSACSINNHIIRFLNVLQTNNKCNWIFTAFYLYPSAVKETFTFFCHFWTHFNGCAQRRVFGRCFWEPEWGGQLHLSAASGQHAICSHARQDGWQLQRELKKRAVLAFPLQLSFFTLFSCSPVK